VAKGNVITPLNALTEKSRKGVSIWPPKHKVFQGDAEGKIPRMTATSTGGRTVTDRHGARDGFMHAMEPKEERESENRARQ